MVRIRLFRVGSKRQPSYRIVVADQRSPRDGRFIEVIGNYNPRTEPNTVVVDRRRALYWLGTGAQPSEAVERLLEQTSVMAIHRGEMTLEEIEEAEAPEGEEPVASVPAAERVEEPVAETSAPEPEESTAEAETAEEA